MSKFVLRRLERETVEGPVVLVICDGFGVAPPSPYNCVSLAAAKSVFWRKAVADARQRGLYCELKVRFSPSHPPSRFR